MILKGITWGIFKAYASIRGRARGEVARRGDDKSICVINLRTGNGLNSSSSLDLTHTHEMRSAMGRRAGRCTPIIAEACLFGCGRFYTHKGCCAFILFAALRRVLDALF